MSALFFDIDGTLLSEKTHQIPQSAKDAIAKAREKGSLAFINSGRCRCMLRSIEEEVPMDGVLCGCGTELYYHGERIYYEALSDEWQQRVVHADKKYNIAIVAEGSEENHYRPGKSRMEPVNYMKAATDRMGAMSDRDFEGHYEISKFCVQADEQSDLEGFRREFGERFTIIDRRGGFYECIPKEHDKGEAIRHLADLLGISMDEVYVFGDSANDLAMFQAAPEHSTAMKKHDPVLDPYTGFVTDRVEQDGIRKALLHYHLI